MPAKQPRLGLFVATLNPIATPGYLAAMAEGADEHGFSSIWCGEHVVQLDEYDSVYPYGDDGRIQLGQGSGLLEPFAALSFMAARSERVRLGTAVTLVPQRNPLYTAKSVSSLDWLTGGRLDFGVGIGWWREEFEAIGAPFEHRAARCAEYLAMMKLLWTEEVASLDGRFHHLPPCRMYPKPVQQPHPPVYFGGESDAALRRVAEMGDGWHGFNVSAADAPELVHRLSTALDSRGRDPAGVDVTVSPFSHATGPEEVAAYGEAGVDQVVLNAPLVGPDQVGDALAGLAEQFSLRAPGPA